MANLRSGRVGAWPLACPGKVQKGQLPGSGASCRRGAPAGMNWTAMVLATAPLSSRMMWTWPSPGSMKALSGVPAVYTCGPAGLASPPSWLPAGGAGTRVVAFCCRLCHARSHARAAVCRSWAAAEHGAQAARHHGGEPAGVREGRGMAGPARGPGGCSTLCLPVTVCGPGLCQAVVEEGWAHRGLLGDVARFGGVAWCRPLISSAGRYRGWFHHHQRPARAPHATAHANTHIIGARPEAAAVAA